MYLAFYDPIKGNILTTCILYGGSGDYYAVFVLASGNPRYKEGTIASFPGTEKPEEIKVGSVAVALHAFHKECKRQRTMININKQYKD